MPSMLEYTPAVSDSGSPAGAAEIKIADGCSRFNLISWKLGCNSTEAPCRFNVTGMREAGGQEIPVKSKVFVIPPCAKHSGNTLTPVAFDGENFSNLSSFSVQLQVGASLAVSWWSDDLRIARLYGGLPRCAAKNNDRSSNRATATPKSSRMWRRWPA